MPHHRDARVPKSPRRIEDRASPFDLDRRRSAVLDQPTRISERFRFVEDAYSVSVVVPYGEGPALVGRLDREGPSRKLYRFLQRYLVNVPRHLIDTWSDQGMVRLAHDAVWVVDASHMYDERYGLRLEKDLQPPPAAYVL